MTSTFGVFCSINVAYVPPPTPEQAMEIALEKSEKHAEKALHQAKIAREAFNKMQADKRPRPVKITKSGSDNFLLRLFKGQVPDLNQFANG